MNNLPLTLKPPAGMDHWQSVLLLALADLDLAAEQLDLAAATVAGMPPMPGYNDSDENLSWCIASAVRMTRFFRGMLATTAGVAVSPALIDHLRRLAPRPRPRQAYAAPSVPALVRERARAMYPVQLAALWLDNGCACLDFYADLTSDVTAMVAHDALESISATLEASILHSESDGGDTIDEVTEAWLDDDDDEDEDGADIGVVDGAAAAAQAADDEPAPLVAPAGESGDADAPRPVRFREWL